HIALPQPGATEQHWVRHAKWTWYDARNNGFSGRGLAALTTFTNKKFSETPRGQQMLKDLTYEQAERLHYPKEKFSFLTAEQADQLLKQGQAVTGTLGRSYTSAAQGRKGDIEMFLGNLSIDSVRGTAAHEITHQRWQTVLDQYMTELAQADDAGALEADGYSLKEGAQARYPTVARLNPTYMDNVTTLVADDGVSPYSRGFWNDYGKFLNDGGYRHDLYKVYAEDQVRRGKEAAEVVPFDQWKNDYRAKLLKTAFHETLAEIACAEAEDETPDASRDWLKFYTTVEGLYEAQRTAPQRRAA
ncbi:MAG: hypothetical protein J2P48_08295, partial [Alphaproteobacteria bacterium]|nr:hypothetical protein [Alphaproteobacteria bacterium]